MFITQYKECTFHVLNLSNVWIYDFYIEVTYSMARVILVVWDLDLCTFMPYTCRKHGTVYTPHESNIIYEGEYILIYDYKAHTAP